MSSNIQIDIINNIKEANLTSKEKSKLIQKVNTTFDAYKEPISKLLWVSIDEIIPNTYNPNKMAVPEKKLLSRSLILHGITSPLIVTCQKEGKYILIDGYHRFNIIKRNKKLRERLDHKVPIVVLNLEDNEKIVATIRLIGQEVSIK